MKNFTKCPSFLRLILAGFLVVLIQPVLIVHAQYALSMGGTSFDEGVEVGVDAHGNAYFIGEFRDTLDFDPGPSEYLLKNLNRDVFVVSYDNLGALRFAFKISGYLASHESAGDIAVADDGSFVIVGSQPFGAIDFDPDPIEEMVRTGEIFVAGYTADGQPRFAVSPNGGENTSSGFGYAVTLDDSGNSYVTGSFITSLDFNPADSTGVLPNSGSSDVFLASYTSSGNYRYAYSFGGTGFDVGTGITLDTKGNVYIAGYFDGEAFFDPKDSNGDGDLEMRTSVDLSDMFLVSYTSDGAFRFVYTYDVASRIEISKKVALSSDAYGNIYMSGESFGTTPFDPEDADNDGNLVNRTADPLGSAFLASYNSDGEIRFATVLKGGPSISRDVFTDKQGTSYITGAFGGDVDFDPDVGEAMFSSRRGEDVFVASYDSLGAYRLAFNLPSTGLSTGVGIAVDSLQNIALTGGFGGDFDIEKGAVEDWRTSAGQNDIFMTWLSGAGQVSVSNESVDSQPEEMALLQPYPNPFRSRTRFAVELASSQDVRVAVFDMLGREVALLHEGFHQSGYHQFTWQPNQLADGIYFIRVETGRTTNVKKVVLMK